MAAKYAWKIEHGWMSTAVWRNVVINAGLETGLIKVMAWMTYKQCLLKINRHITPRPQLLQVQIEDSHFNNDNDRYILYMMELILSEPISRITKDLYQSG